METECTFFDANYYQKSQQILKMRFKNTSNDHGTNFFMNKKIFWTYMGKEKKIDRVPLSHFFQCRPGFIITYFLFFEKPLHLPNFYLLF